MYKKVATWKYCNVILKNEKKTNLEEWKWFVPVHRHGYLGKQNYVIILSHLQK